MDLQAFQNKYQGQDNVGDNSANVGQCVGLIEVWLDANGLSPDHIWGNAIDLINNANPKIFSIGTAWPAPPGAVVVLGKPYGLLQNGSYAGHTGISLGDGNLFEQNDPDGSTPHVKFYGSSAPAGYLGYITASQLSNTPQGVTDMPLTDQQTDFLYRKALGRPAMQSDLEGNRGNDPGGLINALMQSEQNGEGHDYTMELIYHAQLGYLRRPPNQDEIPADILMGMRPYFNGVQKSDEAKQVTAYYDAGKAAAENPPAPAPPAPGDVITPDPPATSDDSTPIPVTQTPPASTNDVVPPSNAPIIPATAPAAPTPNLVSDLNGLQLLWESIKRLFNFKVF